MPFKELLSSLENVLQKPHKAFQGFGSGTTKLCAKFGADMLFNFSVHPRQNKTRSRKSTRVKTMRVHSVVSHGRLMQSACRSVTLASPLIFFHQDSYNSNSPGTFLIEHQNIE
jgi:hypothetical protein